MSTSFCVAEEDAATDDAQRGCGARESETVRDSGVISSISRLSGRVIGEMLYQWEAIVGNGEGRGDHSTEGDVPKSAKP